MKVHITLSVLKQKVDETYEEIMAHSQETGGNEKLQEQIEQFKKLMEMEKPEIHVQTLSWHTRKRQGAMECKKNKWNRMRRYKVWDSQMNL
jgi:UDP-N-acetylglucosamine 2-epimerase